jgi:hypothetical protein
VNAVADPSVENPTYGNSGQNSGRKIMETVRRIAVSNAPTRAYSKK